MELGDKLERSTACVDWERRILAGESLIVGKPLYPEMANRAVRFFAGLVLHDVLGRPRVGDVTRQWVYDFVGAIFGAQNPATLRREIRDFFLLISKKNTKSTIAAGIMLTAMELDQRDGAEYLILAPTKEVADNSFAPIKGMIAHDGYLSAVYHVQSHTRTVTNTVTGARLKVVAADDKTVGGKKATGILIDELHLFGQVANARSIITEATGGLLSRTDGFVIKLSTQSAQPPAGVFKHELEYARKVRDGEILNPKYLPVLYEFPKEMVDSGAFADPANFFVTNPNLGASVDTETLVEEFHKARNSDEAALLEFYAKHLNVEIGLNLRDDRWRAADLWLQNGDDAIDGVGWLVRHCDLITAGIDGGGRDDLLGFALVGRLRDEPGCLVVWAKAFAREIVFERRKQIAPVLEDFIADGDLAVFDEGGGDVEEICALLSDLRDRGLLAKIGMDPSGDLSIYQALEAAGFELNRDVLGVKQGGHLHGDIVFVDRLLYEGRFRHGNQPLMAWCMGNAKVELSGNSMKITKQKAGEGKIDPLVAMLCAVNVMNLNPEPMMAVQAFCDNLIVV